MKPRLLFFDALRFLAFFLVVYYHVSSWIGIPQPIDFVFVGLVKLTLGQIGVYLFIFISGALLMYTHKEHESITDFYIGRFKRIYLPFWLSIIVSIAIFPTLLYKFFDPIGFFEIATGMTVVFGGYVASVSEAHWFIGAIVLMYLFFPLMKKVIDFNPHLAMLLFSTISIVSAIAIIHSWPVAIPDNIHLGVVWFPLCNMMVFGLGMYITKMGVFPKFAIESNAITTLAEFSFFFYLYHGQCYSFIGLYGLAAYLVFVSVLCIASIGFCYLVKKAMSYHTKKLSQPIYPNTS